MNVSGSFLRSSRLHDSAHASHSPVPLGSDTGPASAPVSYPCLCAPASATENICGKETPSPSASLPPMECRPENQTQQVCPRLEGLDPQSLAQQSAHRLWSRCSEWQLLPDPYLLTAPRGQLKEAILSFPSFTQYSRHWEYNREQERQGVRPPAAYSLAGAQIQTSKQTDT